RPMHEAQGCSSMPRLRSMAHITTSRHADRLPIRTLTRGEFPCWARMLAACAAWNPRCAHRISTEDRPRPLPVTWCRGEIPCWARMLAACAAWNPRCVHIALLWRTGRGRVKHGARTDLRASVVDCTIIGCEVRYLWREGVPGSKELRMQGDGKL